MNKSIVTAVILSIMLMTTAYAQMGYEEAEERARKAHEMAASDMIYVQEDTRALYYQNLQMIALLKDIRDQVDRLNQQSEKDPIQK